MQRETTWVLEIDPDDYSINWDQNFHGPYTGSTSNVYDWATGVIIDNDGNYVVTGQCKSCDPDKSHDELMIVKIEPDASYDTTLRHFGYLEHDQVGWDIFQTADDGYISVGVTHPHDGGTACHSNQHDYYVVKVNNNLEATWTDGCQLDEGRNFGGTQNDQAYSVVQTCDGGFLVVGETRSQNYDVSCNYNSPYTYDAWLLKLDANGDYEWDESFGDVGDDAFRDIIRLSDGSFVAVGDIGAGINHNQQDFYIIKFQLIDCDAPQGLSHSVTGYCASMSWTVNPCIPSYDLFYRKVGAGSWTPVYNASSPKTIINPTSTGGNDYEWRVRANCSDDYVTYSTQDYFTLPHCSGTFQGCNNCTPRLADEDIIGKSSDVLSVYPVPSSGAITISLQLPEQVNSVNIDILDCTGRIITSSQGIAESGKLEQEILLTGCQPGLYFLRITTETRVLQSKFVVE